jgi:ABC-type branched-subunit amino acid transport system substrate-binding protein
MFLRRRKTTVVLAAAVALSALLLGACGSSDTEGGDTDEGGAIKIGNWASVTGTGFAFTAPQAKAAAEAAVESINASGGVNGRELEMVFCDEKFDPNQEVACARQMVTEKVSAVVAPEVFYGQGSIPILERAGIPVLASQALSPDAEYVCKTCFPLGGSYSWYWGVDYAMLKAGATKFAVLGNNNGTSKAATEIAVDGLEAAGVSDVRVVNAEPDATDLAPQALQAMADGVDGVVLTTSPQLQTKAIAALRDGGYTGLIGTLTDLLSQEAIDGLGSKAEGILLSSQVAFPDDTTNAGATEFRADMERYAPDEVADTLALAAWAGVKLFASIAESAESYDAAAMLDAIENADVPATEAPALGGFKVKGVTPPVPELPQLFNTNAQIGVVENGAPVHEGSIIDVFEALTNWQSSN